MPKVPTVYDFMKRFPDDDACLEHVMRLRYGETFDCPSCGRNGRYSRIKKRPVYQCSYCSHQISPKVGTPFQKSRTPLQKWFYAIFLFTTTRHGVSAKEIQRQIGVTYKAAWRMGHEIRKYMADVDGDPMLGGHVEVDETVIGGRRKGGKRGRMGENKTIVFGMLERGGDVMTRVVPDVQRDTLEPHIKENVAQGSTISTDELKSYNKLPKAGYEHGSVNHSAEQWRQGIHYTNSLEGYWSIFKRSIRSTHVHVSRKHLDKYLGEFEFRHNLRKDPKLMFDVLVMAF